MTHHPRRRSGQDVLENSWVASSRVRKCSKSMDRVGSCQKIFKYHGSGREGHSDSFRPDSPDVIRSVKSPDYS